ncbi:ABC transporter substrate binding protein [Methylomonas sp. MO1]|uniref:ABC transporter substrate-binding protein n=1 Tax=unclassified Methylomonas TaxID=2608980 RepID=UPI00035FF419|nr:MULTISPECIES: ABC transporter substrate binding protein [unclassified Methylomonas]MDT4290829.1 ABC transporter substrate binding protein [Methylomonas sp. MO1]
MFYRLFFQLGLALCVLWPFCGGAWAQAPTVAIVYPDVREPYRSVFMEIARGMEQELGKPVGHYLLNERDKSVDKLIQDLKNDRIDVVVTLGRAGLAVAKAVSSQFPVVIGATMIRPDEVQGLAGISLTPAPEAMFDHLKKLVPEVKKVTVIYDPRQTAWEIERAGRAALERGLTLVAQPTGNLHDSSDQFRQILLEIKDNSIALWLPRENAAMDESSLLPEVLREAWEKNFVVFSSNLDHVRKGALFSLYPDNFSMGRSLAGLAIQQLQAGGKFESVELLRDLLVAVNLRTAEHLGLRFSSQTRREFAMVFPVP